MSEIEMIVGDSGFECSGGYAETHTRGGSVRQRSECPARFATDPPSPADRVCAISIPDHRHVHRVSKKSHH